MKKLFQFAYKKKKQYLLGFILGAAFSAVSIPELFPVDPNDGQTAVVLTRLWIAGCCVFTTAMWAIITEDYLKYKKDNEQLSNKKE